MSLREHDEFHEYDAAYVLGSLSPADRRAFEEHLTDCPECARAVQEIAGVPGLLATVPRSVVEEGVEDPGPVPDTLLPRLVREVRRRRTRRGWAIGAAAAVAAGALTLGGVGIAGALGPETLTAAVEPAAGSTTPSSEATMHPVGQERLHATVAFTSRPWGTSVDLTCAYDAGGGYPAGDRPTYVLVVRRDDGTAQQVATWRALPGREMTLSGASSWERADIAQVEVQTETGRAVLRLNS